MVTALPRIQVTRTPIVERALACAAKRWPGAPKSEQLTKLLELAVDRIQAETDERRATRRAALLEIRGTYDYPPDYLAELRAEDRE